MVPIRWLAKALSVDVEWDGNNEIVKLTLVVERPILFTRIAFSKDRQKATKPPLIFFAQFKANTTGFMPYEVASAVVTVQMRSISYK